MIRIILCGYGRMGKLIQKTIEEREDMEIVMIVDESNQKDLYSLEKPADLLMDFSNPSSFPLLYSYVKQTHCALLSGTTGYREEQLAQLQELSTLAPIMHAANYSLGVAIFQQVLKQITPLLNEEFDMEIVEAHHNQKVDAPSGTAKLLLDAMDPNHEFREVNGRNGNCGKRGKEIGVHAIRGGTVAGEHTVMFLGNDEKLEIKHTATSRQIFVNGAITAANWIVKQNAGYYDMQDLVKDSL